MNSKYFLFKISFQVPTHCLNVCVLCLTFKKGKLVDMHQHTNTLIQILGPTSAPLHIEIMKNTKSTTENGKQKT